MTEYLAPYVHLDVIGDQTSSTPIICNRIPEPLESGVTPTYTTQLDIWNPTAIGFKPETLQITINDISAIINGVIQSPFSGSITYTYQSAWGRIILSGVTWKSLSNINVTVVVDTWDGNSINDTYTYVIADTTAPELSTVNSIGRKVIRVVYSQSVIDTTASTVVATFPWGNENLIYDNDLKSWVLNDATYPYLASTVLEPYPIAEGTILGLILNGVEKLIAVPATLSDDAATVAAALSPVLIPIGADALAYNNRLYIRNLDSTGTIKVVDRGAQAILKLEDGVRYPRLPFGTAEGAYAIPTKATFTSGTIEFQTVTLDLTNSDVTIQLVDTSISMSDSVLDIDNYTLTYNQALVLSEIRPTWVPSIESVTRISDNTVDLLLDTDITPLGPYILTVNSVYDVSGNLISSNHNTKSFRGYSPQTPANRKFDLYQMHPQYNRQEDQDHDLTLLKFMRVLQEVQNQILADMDVYTEIFNLDNAPDWYISAFLTSKGSPFDFMPIDATKRRQLATILVDLLRIRATNPGIEAALKFFFDFTTVTITPCWGLGWKLGDPTRSVLGSTTVLNSSVRRDKYSFVIEVDRVLTEDELWQVNRVIEVTKPDHIHIKAIKQPEEPFVPNHWQLGYSVLGVNTILH